jgi:PTH1 family peptidyl-tRNA hydrolase
LKYLIVGLGNIGKEYELTRHNIGFMVLDAWVSASSIFFEQKRYAYQATISLKGRKAILIKPTTYMNLSGNAVNFWLYTEKIPIENMLVIVDDIALPFGTIRIRPKGANGGHNGLAHIDEILKTNEYPRLRFGIGNNYSRGKQVEYVLSPFTQEEQKVLPYYINIMINAIENFILEGINSTMNKYNKLWLPPKEGNV